MAYRAKSYREPCAVCESIATERCSLCGKFVCKDHALDDACIDCASDEYIEDARLGSRWGKLALGSLVGMPLGVALGLMFSSAMPALIGLAGGYVAPWVAGAGYSFVRYRRHRGRRKLRGRGGRGGRPRLRLPP